MLAVPILLLYMLRLRRRDVVVPSTLLWQAVLADRHANRPWQKLRRNWLLFLQLWVLLALVLALVRPALPAPLALHGQLIVLLDASASMQTRLVEEEGTRFDAAVHALRELATTLEAEDRVALIAVGPEPHLLLQGGDAGDLQRVLDAVVDDALANDIPYHGGGNWPAAAALAAGLASATTTTLLVTDAAIPEDLPALPGTVRVIVVGDAVPNVGIVALALRRTDTRLTLFTRLYNAGPATTRTLAVYADGVLIARESVALPAEGDVPLTFPDISVAAWVEARLEESDALEVDNRAWVALSEGGQGRVLLVTQGNRFLTQALQSLPGVTLVQATTPLMAAEPVEGYRDDPYGLWIVDGPVTDTLSGVNQWHIAPDAGTLCGIPGDIITPTAVVRGKWSHALLQYVNWDDVHIARARYYTPPADAEVLIETSAAPLLWVIARPNVRVACLAFNLHDADLPLRLAFPILTANLTGWLLPQISTEPVVPYPAGEPWQPALPPEATAATLVAPDGTRYGLGPALDRAFSSLPTRAGLYQIEAQTAAGFVTRYAALAMLDAAESDVRPRDIRIAGQIVPSITETTPGWRDLRRWPLVVALILLLLEAGLWWGKETTIKKREPRTEHDVPRFTFHVSRLTHYVSRFFSIAVVLRLLLILFLIAALFGFRWPRRTRDLAVVFVLDRSASVQSAWEAQVNYVEAALAHKSPRDRAALVIFGREAWVDRPLSPSSELHTIATLPRADATDIEEAARLALALIP
ncbi:MAG: VWA domain-containing protein, partial [Anaerolineae bacterium]|nr:VWA domain-containing protein [Anaerolineae bacterium]